MASMLARPAFLRYRLGLCSSRLPLFRQSDHMSRQIHSDYPGYQRIRFRNLNKKQIFLWNGDEMLGVMRMKRVLRDFLGPGKTLSWRPDSDAVGGLVSDSDKAVDGKCKKHLSRPRSPDDEVRHYEIMSISELESEPDSDLSGQTQENGTHRVSFRSDLGLASSPQAQLAGTYYFFGDSEEGARYPVEFHISSPKTGKSSYDATWAVKNRVDFHPDVIKRAMPEGVRFTTKPHMRMNGKEVFWYFAAKDYDPGLQTDETSSEQSSMEGGRKSARQKKKLARQRKRRVFASKTSGGLADLIRPMVPERREDDRERVKPRSGD